MIVLQCVCVALSLAGAGEVRYINYVKLLLKYQFKIFSHFINKVNASFFLLGYTKIVIHGL